MIDREKVINGLKCCGSKGMSTCASEKCPYYPDKYEWDECTSQLANDALELLKEQKVIVRCEDCKHRPTYPEAYGAEINGRWCYWCELLMAWKPDDWFCAYGERR